MILVENLKNVLSKIYIKKAMVLKHVTICVGFVALVM